MMHQPCPPPESPSLLPPLLPPLFVNEYILIHEVVLLVHFLLLAQLRIFLRILLSPLFYFRFDYYVSVEVSHCFYSTAHVRPSDIIAPSSPTFHPLSLPLSSLKAFPATIVSRYINWLKIQL